MSKNVELTQFEGQRRHSLWNRPSQRGNGITHKIVEKSDAHLIEKQLKHYAVIALEMSSIIVSSKASYSLIQSLKNVHPILQQNGIQLVYVSDILKEIKQK